MMVKAGKPVDTVIGEIAPLLEKGDVMIDGGNSLFTDTQRRGKELEGTGIHFVGMGVSGGEEGALKGSFAHAGRLARVMGNHCADFSQDRRAGGWRAVLPLHGARTAPVITSRWCTTASSTAISS